MNLKVKDIMSKNVICVSPEDKICDIIRIFSEQKISGVPVTKGGKIVGIVTEADILELLGKRNLLAIDQGALQRKGETKVEEIMKKIVIVANQNDGLDRAVLLMTLYKVRRLPVVDDKNNIVGVVARDDVIKSVSSLMGQKAVLTKPTVPQQQDERKPISVEKEIVEEKEEIGEVPSSMETDIDKILVVIKERKKIKFGELQKMFSVDKSTIEQWAKILEDHGLAEIFYPTLGEPELRWKK